MENFRSFRDTEIRLVRPDANFEELGVPVPRLRNVNLLLGDNGSGKTTFLRAIALAALGPAVRSSGIYADRLIRREPVKSKRAPVENAGAEIDATFVLHAQDGGSGRSARSRVSVARRGDLEEFEWTKDEESLWTPVFRAKEWAFFAVGYGATRRVESRESVDLGSRRKVSFARAQRIRSLFEDAHSLVPLNVWLPDLESRNRGRYVQVLNLVNRLAGPGHYAFKGERDDRGEYLFERGGLKVPFGALSDGYRAFLGWVGDLLYHVCETCPSGAKLVENRGVVMVDEIDLHLHPKWQMKVLGTISRALPNVQFVFTSHSPLLVGSLEWANVIAMKPARDQSSRAERIERPIHGLDADQILLTDMFGLSSTRAAGRRTHLKKLSAKARGGDLEAASLLLEAMSRGGERAT